MLEREEKKTSSAGISDSKNDLSACIIYIYIYLCVCVGGFFFFGILEMVFQKVFVF